MFKKYKLYILLIFLLGVFTLGYGERTKDKMYETIASTKGCYRRLNGTHQIGCSSKRGGSTGVIHYCNTVNDLNFILTNGTAGPYIPILPTFLFTTETVNKLSSSDNVAGLILHKNNDKLNYFTHEHQCPNPTSSLNGTCNSNSLWNPYGTSLLYADIPFPIFYVENEEEVLKLKDCFNKFNNFSYETQGDRSLCSLELKSFMFATTNSQTCRRRSYVITNLNPVKFCDPLGDSNIWATLYPLVKGPSWNETRPIRDYKYIVIAARIDTTSMFDKTSGANSPVTGIVTLLSTAKLLKEMLMVDDIDKAKKNILFTLFNGETFDYIGSQRLLYDMKRGAFPVDGLGDNSDILPTIRPENISLFIELSQLGNSKDKLFVHYYDEKTEIQNFYKYLTQNSGAIKLKNVVQSLPPASLHTFLKNNSEFPGLILSDHEKSYTNTFYNSIYDDSSNIEYIYYNTTQNDSIPKNSIQQFLASVSEMVARSVFEEIKETKYNGNITMDVVLVDELLHCYLNDSNCKVHMAIQKSKFPQAPASLYIGVDHVSNFATHLTKLTLAWFIGDVVTEENVNCIKSKNPAFRYYNMSKSIYELNITQCFKVTINTTEAKSPAFEIENYDWSSGQYSTWTESIWPDMGVRMFLKPSAAHEKMTIAIGSMSLIFSFILVYFMKSRSHILFTPPLPTEAPTDC